MATSWRILFFYALLVLCTRGAPTASTVFIRPGQVQCFYADIAKTEEEKWTTEVFVFKGGNLDIGLTIKGPLSKKDKEGHPIDPSPKEKLAVDIAKVILEGSIDDDDDSSEEEEVEPDDEAFVLGDSPRHEFDAKAGTYSVCLHNDRRFIQENKHVLLRMFKSSEEVDNVVLPTTDDSIGSDYGEEEESVEGGTKPSQKEDEGIHLKAIAEDMQRLKTFLAKIETKQLHERMRLAVQETMAKENQEGMVRSSVIETVVLLLVSCGQIFFVRRWFQGKGTLLKHWSS